MKREQGMALLMVLLMMSVMAVIAVSINNYWQRSLTRAQTQQDQIRAKWLLSGGEIYAKKWLQQSLDKQTSVNLGQVWQRDNLVMRTEEGEILVRINNIDTCFNLNSLAASSEPQTDKSGAQKRQISKEKQIFMLLLTNLGVSQQQAETIANAVIVKISGKPGLSATDYLFADTSELREINLISRELYLRMSPLVCALPNKSLKINVNTITTQQLPLLRAVLQNKLDNKQVLALIADRPANGWHSLDFLTADNYPQLHKMKGGGLTDRLVTTGNDFSAELRVKLDSGYYWLVSTLQRSAAGVKVIRRQFGWGE